MKIRNGFVSNSSSSSFIIACKGSLDADKLKELIMSKLKVPQDSPLFFIAESIGNLFANANEYEIENLKWETDMIQQLVKDGYILHCVSVASDAGSVDGVEEMLYYNDIIENVDTPELKIMKDY